MSEEYQFSRPNNVVRQLSCNLEINGVPGLLNGILDLSKAEHVQGITGYDSKDGMYSYVIISYSYDDKDNTPGYIIFCDKATGKMVNSIQLLDHKRHPSGMQTIGDYLVIHAGARYNDDDYGEKKHSDFLQIYDLTNLLDADPKNPELIAELYLEEKDGKSYSDLPARCVGICDFDYKNGEKRYLLALPTHEGNKQRTYFYISKFSKLSDLNKASGSLLNYFDLCGKDQVFSSEACGLVTRADNTVFFVGFRSDGVSDLIDHIDIWKVMFNEDRSEVALADEPDVSTHVYTSDGKLQHNGIHFRWGGGLEILNNKTIACYVPERYCNSKGEIQYDTFIADLSQDILWADTQTIGYGREIAVAMDNDGHCLEVHRDQKDDTLYYYSGNIDFEKGVITFLNSDQIQKYCKSGQTPAIALDKSNKNCILVHRGIDNKDKLFFDIGSIDFVTGKLDVSEFDDTIQGKWPSIALDSEGKNNFLEAHQGYHNDNDVFYHTGSIDFSNKEIDFESNQDPYDSGHMPSIALSKSGAYCVEVHTGTNCQNEEDIYCNLGQVDYDKGKIDFGDNFSFTNGQEPSIAYDSEIGHCVVVYQDQDGNYLNDLYYCTGAVDTENLTIKMNTGKKIYSKGIKPSISMDNHGNCLEVHYDLKNKLYYTVGKIAKV